MSGILPQEKQWVIDGIFGVGRIESVYPEKGMSAGYFLDPSNKTKLIHVAIPNKRIKKVIDDQRKIVLFEKNLEIFLLEGGI